MKVLVTGANGFIGNAVARELVATGFDVIACVRSMVLSPAEMGRVYCGEMGGPAFQQLLRDETPDYVVHCAGAASVGASIAKPDLDYASNVVLTRNLYACIAVASPSTRILFMSSAAVYGQPEQLPITESTQCKPMSPYGLHKLKCEEIGQWFRDNHGLQITDLRIFSAYGPGLKKQVLWDTYLKSLKDNCVELAGDGSETRDFVYIRDLTNLVMAIIQDSSWNENRINVASGESVTIRELAKMFLSELGHRGQLRFSGTISVGSPCFWKADNSKLLGLGLRPSVALEDGLREYVRWIRDSEGTFDSNRILARAG
jgi:UDP-glucose 4-epimerase